MANRKLVFSSQERITVHLEDQPCGPAQNIKKYNRAIIHADPGTLSKTGLVDFCDHCFPEYEFK